MAKIVSPQLVFFMSYKSVNKINLCAQHLKTKFACLSVAVFNYRFCEHTFLFQICTSKVIHLNLYKCMWQPFRPIVYVCYSLCTLYVIVYVCYSVCVFKTQ